MTLAYYPGCTLKRKGASFESSALAAMRALGVNMKEIKRWTCCGTVHSLDDDDLFHKVAPIRNLVRVEEMGSDRVVALCSMCLHTLKLANELVKNDNDKLKTINDFMDEEPPYSGDVDVLHLLEVLRDDIGYGTIRKHVKKPLLGLRVAPYYGCLLTRPKAGAIDDFEEPRIMHDLLEALGAEVIDDPFKTECCGSYHIIDNQPAVESRTELIVSSAARNGADMLALSCPLCDYNLEKAQLEIKENKPAFTVLPVVYFTQLLAIALGEAVEVCLFDKHLINPTPVFQEHGLLSATTSVKNIQSKSKESAI